MAAFLFTLPCMFVDQLMRRVEAQNTRLCVGLDPRRHLYSDVAALRRHTLEVLEATAPYAAAVKPQLAFFEALGLAGFELLEEVCAKARELELPIILDAKRGDIGSTAEAYAQAWLRGTHAGDALTVNPFLGFETLQPFVQAAREEGGAIFVLVKTSNPDQADLQGNGVSERIAAEITRLNADATTYGVVGAVVGATHPQDLSRFRALLPGALLLLPGLGAQGASAAELAGAFDAQGHGALANASRAVQYADGLNISASVQAAQMLRDQLNQALKER